MQYNLRHMEYTQARGIHALLTAMQNCELHNTAAGP